MDKDQDTAAACHFFVAQSGGDDRFAPSGRTGQEKATATARDLALDIRNRLLLIGP
jgi:hypothetical protein